MPGSLSPQATWFWGRSSPAQPTHEEVVVFINAYQHCRSKPDHDQVGVFPCVRFRPFLRPLLSLGGKCGTSVPPRVKITLDTGFLKTSVIWLAAHISRLPPADEARMICKMCSLRSSARMCSASGCQFSGGTPARIRLSPTVRKILWF